MEEYTFTERHAEVFSRFMVAIADKLDTQLKELNEDADREEWLRNKCDDNGHAYFKYNSFNGWALQMEWCNASESSDTTIIGISIELSHVKNPDRPVGCWDYGKQNFHRLVGTHHPCSECGTMEHTLMISEKLATTYDNYFCDDCFSKIIKHKEECCCCMENNYAVWYKLPCNHVLHKKCFEKIDLDGTPHYRRKCPLCRQKANCHEVVYL
jgi:hypothetical protein